ncbi:hypothetical protein FRB95_004081 [Tulasnella sp. JGI-2019a]|nr:hypothetical protein FRB95_004081 [Tulasnella sp. JGI-2019a]
MSQVINTRLGRMKDALSENTPDALQLKGLWQDLLVCIDAPTDDGVDQWIKLSSSGIVTSAINLLMTAVDRDSTLSGVYAAELANRCSACALQALPYLDAARSNFAQTFLENYSDTGLVAIQLWWKKFRYLVLVYIQENDLENTLRSFVNLFGLCSRGDILSINTAVTASVDLYNFLLFVAVFLDPRNQLKSVINFAMSAATTSCVPRHMSRLLSLSTARELLKSQPDALHLRFKELLEIADSFEIFLTL